MNNWKTWLNGLVGGFIGGGAAAATSGPVASMIAPETFTHMKPLLELMGSMFLVNGIIGGLLYLKQHPTPWDGADRRVTNGGQRP